MIVYAVELERIANDASGECRIILQRTIVAVLAIISISLGIPPGDETIKKGSAGSWNINVFKYPVQRDGFVFEDHRLIERQRRDLWRVVHRGDVDSEGLHGAFIVTAVERAAVVSQLEADRGAAVGVGRQRVGQLATGVHGRIGGEQTWIAVAGDDEAQRLTGLIGRSRRETRRPGGDGMRAAVFQHVLIGTLAERRFVVDGIDGDRDLLRLRSIVPAVGRATVVLHLNVERGRTVGIRGRCVSQIAAGIHAGRRGKQARIADIADRVGQYALA